MDYDTDGLSKSGLIYRTASSWYIAPFTQRTVQITYVAGYTAAALAIAAVLLKRRDV